MRMSVGVAHYTEKQLRQTAVVSVLREPVSWLAVPEKAHDGEPLHPDCAEGKGESTPCAAASCPVAPLGFLFLCHPFPLR